MNYVKNAKQMIQNMPTCKFCNQENLEWYEDHLGKWRLGIKIDINNFRKHTCSPIKEESSNKRNWIKFNCENCKKETRQNVKLYKSKTINLCYDCDNSCSKLLLQDN